jgi:hypothetical protein
MPKLLDKVRKQIELVERSIEKVDGVTADLGYLKIGEAVRPPVDNFRCAEFRLNKFKFRDDLKLTNLSSQAGRNITYADLCSMLRKYIIGNGLMLENGRIQCDSVLKTITNKDETSFFDIAKSFTAILA